MLISPQKFDEKQRNQQIGLHKPRARAERAATSLQEDVMKE